jgi:meso-butanediol dehydrogenase/(S,S)-butanediol dehydrogenase/diacetyl reductase
MRFRKKVAVVTGGAGGVGRALVRKLTGEGAAVMVADLSAEGCRTLVEEIDGTIDFLAGDVRDRAYCEQVVGETVARFGGVDNLFNNAGIIPRGTILETTDDMWHAALGVNLTAMFYMSRAAIPAMKERGGGAIVNTSSVWGVYPGPGHIAYCTSKGAVASFTKSLGRDHAPDGIRVKRRLPARDQHADAALRVRAPGAGSGQGRRGSEQDGAAGPHRGARGDRGRHGVPRLRRGRYIAGETVEVTAAKPVGS